MKISDLKISQQNVWFTQNKYKKYTPLNKKGRLALLVPLVLFGLHLFAMISIIDMTEAFISSTSLDIAIVGAIVIHTTLFIYTVAQVTTLTGEKYSEK